jgi:hypothetical protein
VRFAGKAVALAAFAVGFIFVSIFFTQWVLLAGFVAIVGGVCGCTYKEAELEHRNRLIDQNEDLLKDLESCVWCKNYGREWIPDTKLLSVDELEKRIIEEKERRGSQNET